MGNHLKLKDIPLLLELAPESNTDENRNLGIGSNKKILWQCEKGHKWEAVIGNRARVSGGSCPICVNKKVLKGFNDLSTIRPDIAKEWHPTKNGELDSSEITTGSKKQVWWWCDKGHEWEAVVYSRTTRRGAGCPYCGNKKTLRGFNDLPSVYPQIAKEWHPTKNGELKVGMLVYGSHKKVWWLGECGHEWETKVVKRTLGKTGCPYCTSQKVLAGFNDLATFSPVLAAQWSEKNSFKPQEVAPKSNKKAIWVCDNNHEWISVINNRTSLGRGCPYCSNQRILKGEDDFAHLYPELAKGWHPTKNGALKPEEISAGTDIKIWFLCEKGHEWSTSLSHRTGSKQTGCPKCANQISKQEERLIAILGRDLNLEISTRKIIPPHELDIYIPSKGVAIEFNGVYWHSERTGRDSKYHYNKWLACKEKNIQLIQIWEDDWNRNENQIVKMLKYKLGISIEQKVYARNTTISIIKNTEAEIFLAENHIQGYSSGSYYLGLKNTKNEDLVAVMILKKEPDTNSNSLNIIRYATSSNVVGGFSKLITYVEKTYNPEKIITFSDNCVSDGKLYSKNGFVAEKSIPPDYMYVIKGERKHKFGYRISRFKNDPLLKYEEGLTEKELAQLNNLFRIWDAGKIRWVKHSC